MMSSMASTSANLPTLLPIALNAGPYRFNFASRPANKRQALHFRSGMAE